MLLSLPRLSRALAWTRREGGRYPLLVSSTKQGLTKTDKMGCGRRKVEIRRFTLVIVMLPSDGIVWVHQNWFCSTNFHIKVSRSTFVACWFQAFLLVTQQPHVWVVSYTPYIMKWGVRKNTDRGQEDARWIAMMPQNRNTWHDKQMVTVGLCMG